MSTETANLIVACVSLVVMGITLYIACRTLRYMKESERARNDREKELRRKDILNKIRIKEQQLNSLKDSHWFHVDVNEAGLIRTQETLLSAEISKLYEQLYDE